MPYVTKLTRDLLDDGHQPITVGDLTYILTREALRFKRTQGAQGFVTIALVMGAFICAALEFYRRVAVPFEDTKIKENGDVYG